MSDSATPWTEAQASPSFTPPQSLLKLMSIGSVMPSNHLVLSRLLLLPSVFPSIRVFSKESALHRWPKYWSFSFSISPSNEYSRLIYFRMDWYDLLAVQGTLKSLLQHHRSKASVLQPSSWPNSHIHTQLQGKAIALTIWTFIGKVMSASWYIVHVCHNFSQGASVFWFHDWSYHLQWFWSPKKWSLPLFPFFRCLFAVK